MAAEILRVRVMLLFKCVITSVGESFLKSFIFPAMIAGKNARYPIRRSINADDTNLYLSCDA